MKINHSVDAFLFSVQTLSTADADEINAVGFIVNI